METKLNRMEKNVLMVYALDKSVADNYNHLLSVYWQVNDLVSNINDLAIAGTPAETITRAFRSLVKKGLIVPSKQTHTARQEKEVEMRTIYGN